MSEAVLLFDLASMMTHMPSLPWPAQMCTHTHEEPCRQEGGISTLSSYIRSRKTLSLPSYSRQQHPTPPRVLLRVCNVVHGGCGGDANADARAINLALE